MCSSHSLYIVTLIGGGRFVALSDDDLNVLVMFFTPLACVNANDFEFCDVLGCHGTDIFLRSNK